MPRIVRPVPLRDRGEDGGTGGLITDCAEQTRGLADLTIVSRHVLQQTQIAAEDGHGRDRHGHENLEARHAALSRGRSQRVASLRSSRRYRAPAETVTLDAAVQGGTTVSVTLGDITATGGASPLASPEDYNNVVADLIFTGTAGETQQFTVATLDDVLARQIDMGGGPGGAGMQHPAILTPATRFA